MSATLEHVNLTVSDPDATARWMCDLFGWHIRWQGEAMKQGRTVHVGSKTDYLALYSPAETAKAGGNSYEAIGGLNHIGVIVDDLDATQDKVVKAGFTPKDFGDYEPGRRFYFRDHDGIEFEIVQYD